MTDLKFEWPYIRLITLEDRKNYESNLPEDPDTLKVHHLVSSPRWQCLTLRLLRSDKTYLTPEYVAFMDKIGREHTVGWFLHFALIGLAFRSASGWYKMDLHRNYLSFKHESMAAYISKRFWPGVAGLWCFGMNATGVYPGDLWIAKTLASFLE
jgi:hypothetical protein